MEEKENPPKKKKLNRKHPMTYDNTSYSFSPPSFRAIGVLTYVFLSGCTPFGGDTDQETFVNITQAEFDFPEDLFADVSEQAKDFICGLLVKKPRWVLFFSRLTHVSSFHLFFILFFFLFI